MIIFVKSISHTRGTISQKSMISWKDDTLWHVSPQFWSLGSQQLTDHLGRSDSDGKNVILLWKFMSFKA